MTCSTASRTFPFTRDRREMEAAGGSSLAELCQLMKKMRCRDCRVEDVTAAIPRTRTRDGNDPSLSNDLS